MCHIALKPGMIFWFIKTPSTRSWVFSKTDTFSQNTATVHTKPAPKTEVFKYALQGAGDFFENGDSSYLCGRVKTKVFKYDDVMPRFKARSSAHTIRKRYVFMQFFF